MRVEEVKKTTDHVDGGVARLVQPAVTDPAQRARILKEVVARMRNNPIPEDAPRLTRESLHESR